MEEAYQSLYRRFRPQRFSEVLGQEHVVKALRNAVREGRVGHAYLFSGPRGTGKTSTARILAKVLNCEHPADGEPCGACPSCRAVEAGTSFDVHEHDAASSRGIDDMRAILDSVHLGTPGRTKVYILDEVHQLTPPAVAALLKTLEEPPGHVVFVLATTDPQKVPQTIISRTQHLQFHLLAADVLAGHVRAVSERAALALPEGAVEHVVRKGGGSARDTLSYLDQVVAAGGIADDGASVDEVVDALADADTTRALAAVASAVRAGRDARTMAEQVIAQVRDGFLAGFDPALVDLPASDRDRVVEQGRRLGAARAVRAMEVLGQALVDMRWAPDARVLLDVALVKLTHLAADDSPAALLERLERLERAVARGGTSPATPPGAPAAITPAGATGDGKARSSAAGAAGPAGGTRAALGAAARATAPAPRDQRATPAPVGGEAPPTPAAPAPAAPTPAGAAPVAASPAGAGLPSRDQLTLAWPDDILPKLKPGVKALFAAGRFVSVDGGAAHFAVPNAPHRDKCEAKRADVEAALAAHFGRPVPLRVIVEGSPAPAGGPPGGPPGGAGGREAAAGQPRRPARPADADTGAVDEDIDLSELTDATGPPESHIDRIADAFPGAELVEE